MRLAFFLLLPFCFFWGAVWSQPCVDQDLIDPTAICPFIFDPVCGCNGVTYSNACEATVYGGVTAFEPGPCSGNPDSFPDGPCTSLPSDALGLCDAVLGWGRVDGLCTNINGCGSDYQGVDWSDYIYPTLEECAFACDTPCIQPALIEMGATIACVEVYEPVCGCDGVTYSNSCHATFIGGVVSWTEGPCIIIETGGCTYPQACNYDPNAFFEDGSCTFPPIGCPWSDDWSPGCTYPDAVNYDPTAAVDDGSCQYEIDTMCPGDMNGDNLISVSDVLGILGLFGTACP